MKNTLLFLLILSSCLGYSQETLSNYKKKRVAVTDSIVIDSLSINPFKFTVKTRDGKLLDSTLYFVDFAKAILRFKQPVNIDSIDIEYLL